MGLLDKIRPKKKQEKSSHEESVLPASPKTASRGGEMVRPPAESEGAPQGNFPVIKDDTGSAYRILMSPHVSEKTSMFAQNGRYVFKVNDKSNKIEIRKAVEKAYDVHVVSVNIVNTKGKSRRMGRRVGRTSDWKKAIVTLKPGEKIQGLVESV